MPSEMTDKEAFVDALEKLRTRLVDATGGYDEALEHAEPDVAPALRRMRSRHESDIDEISRHLAQLQGHPSKDGSWMTPVQKTVMQVRAWLTGIDEGVLPAVVRGERSLLDLYDDAIALAEGWPSTLQLLSRQRSSLADAIDSLAGRPV